MLRWQLCTFFHDLKYFEKTKKNNNNAYDLYKFPNTLFLFYFKSYVAQFLVEPFFSIGVKCHFKLAKTVLKWSKKENVRFCAVLQAFLSLSSAVSYVRSLDAQGKKKEKS